MNEDLEARESKKCSGIERSSMGLEFKSTKKTGKELKLQG